MWPRLSRSRDPTYFTERQVTKYMAGLTPLKDTTETFLDTPVDDRQGKETTERNASGIG